MSYLGQVELKSSEIRRIDVTGSTSATHTLTWTPASEQSLIITINGIKQQNNYSISGVTLTLDDALLSADKMEVIGILDIGEATIPPDDSITTAMVKDDAIDADKLANSINTEIAANTAKVTNATHTGDVTGATALTIATDAVDIPMLSATGTASASTFLRGDNSWTAISEYDDSGLQDDIALIAFKVTANGSLAKYNLVDQVIDGFEDDSGVDASSTDATVDPVNNYVSGRPITAHDPYATYIVTDSANTINAATPRKMTVGTRGIGNMFIGSANIGPSDLDYISSGSGYDISYIVVDDVATSPEFQPGFTTTYSGDYTNNYKYDMTPTYYNAGDTIKTNLISNGSTATITWYHKPNGESTFDQVSQTTDLGITNWYVWAAAWCDSGSHAVTYTAEYTGSPSDMTLISTATTAEDGAPTKGDLVVTYTDAAGTAVVGTDIKFYISRDGTNYTGPITMTSQGTSGGHKILTAHDVSLTSTSGTSMRYKITTHNQSASKETRIQAVSLGWS